MTPQPAQIALAEANSDPEPDVAGFTLEARNISVTYRSSRGPQKAIDDLSLSIRPGEFVSILGPSGCGKSTLLNIAAGLMAPSQGSLSILGNVVTKPRPDVGIVFQKPCLLPWATVFENVLLPIRAVGGNLNAARTKVSELLAFVGLASFAQHYPDELSGGMQQRVGIARALIREPSLLLMDEPFAALDAMTRERMSMELQSIWGTTRKTVLFITHSIPEAVFLSDRVFVMTASPGRIRAELQVDLPRPRTLESMSSPAFGAICGRLRRMFDEQERVN